MEAVQTTERPLKKQQRTIGTIVKIPLENGFHTYARILDDACFAFYDARTKNNLEPSEIIQKEVLFITAVYDYVVKKGYWEKISKKIPLEEQFQILPPTYIQDSIDPTQFRILESDGMTMRSATREECQGLEVSAVWDYDEIEKRLNDHYANRPNPDVDAMRQLRLYSEMTKDPDFKEKYGLE